MKQNKKNLRAMAFSMVLAAGLLLPAGASAQQRDGLFGYAQSPSDAKTEGLFNTGNNRTAVTLNLQDINNYGLGEPEPDAPLGSGLAVLLAAGLGYVALKKKKED